MRRVLVVAFVVALVLVALFTGCTDVPTAPPPSQAVGPQTASYIVSVTRAASPAAIAAVHGARPTYVFNALRSFVAELNSAQVAALQRNLQWVRRIEPDVPVFPLTVGSWGIDRIDQHNLPLDDSYTSVYDGTGVRAYIIDTGIRPTRLDFGGRASVGFDALGGDGQDCHGHGTHVAGTIGSSVYGVARAVQLVAMRSLNCTALGTTGSVLASIDWILLNGQRPAVVNMSLGVVPSNENLDEGVWFLTQLGYTVVVAAGNSDDDACVRSPARVPEAITVGATSAQDARASFSSWGTCVDLFAPGVDIISSAHFDDTSALAGTGTSFAAPHVSGIAALYLQQRPSAWPNEVHEAVNAGATIGVVQDPKGAPNRLAYTAVPLLVSPPPPPPDPGPLPTLAVPDAPSATIVCCTWKQQGKVYTSSSWSWPVVANATQYDLEITGPSTFSVSVTPTTWAVTLSHGTWQGRVRASDGDRVTAWSPYTTLEVCLTGGGPNGGYCGGARK